MVFDTSQPPGTQGSSPPRWQAWVDAPQGTLFNELLAVGDVSITTSYLAGGSPFLVAGQERESLRIGIGGIPGYAYSGAMSWGTSAGNGSLYKESYKLTLMAYDKGSLTLGGALLSVGGDSKVFLPTMKVGSSDTSPINIISVAGVQGTDISTIIDAAGF